MGWDILYDPERDLATFYCDTSDKAFGPVITGLPGVPAKQVLEQFVEYADVDDPRELLERGMSERDPELDKRFNEWYAQVTA